MASLLRSFVSGPSSSRLPLRTFSTTLPALANNPLKGLDIKGFNVNSLPDNTRPSHGASSSVPSSPADSQFKWWQTASEARANGQVNTQYTSRTFTVQRGREGGYGGFSNAVYGLTKILKICGVKRHVRLSEVYEKPSEKRVRLNSLRHRRRFKAMVREKVQLVNLYQSRR